MHNVWVVGRNGKEKAVGCARKKSYKLTCMLFAGKRKLLHVYFFLFCGTLIRLSYLKTKRQAIVGVKIRYYHLKLKLMSGKKIIVRLENAWMAIEGALNDEEIIKALKPYGYSRQEILKGKALYNDADALHNNRSVKFSRQRKATDHFNHARLEAHAIYIRHVQLARLVVPPDRTRYPLLHLNGSRKRAFTEWLSQARAFYQNISLIAEELARQGVTPEELEQAAAMVDAVTAARVQQNAHKSRVQQSKEERDAALEALNVWMEDFTRTVRFAFAKNPRQLEALGVAVKS